MLGTLDVTGLEHRAPFNFLTAQPLTWMGHIDDTVALSKTFPHPNIPPERAEWFIPHFPGRFQQSILRLVQHVSHFCRTRWRQSNGAMKHSYQWWVIICVEWMKNWRHSRMKLRFLRVEKPRRESSDNKKDFKKENGHCKEKKMEGYDCWDKE